jgi:peptidoglycan hydrolase CwlO-like protein
MDSMADDKAHAAPIQPPDEALRADVKQIARDVSDLKSSVAQIEGRLTSVERSVAELQQDVKTIKLAIR